MTARYIEVADDLRRRMRHGEWALQAPFPTIQELQDYYAVPSLGTIRDAFSILIAEGLLRTAQGKRTVVTALPLVDDVTRAALAAQITRIRAAADLAAAALDAETLSTRGNSDPQQPTWSWASSTFCRTCGHGVDGVTRGWEEDDYLDAGPSTHDLDHDVVTLIGLTSPEDQDAAIQGEIWWEIFAYRARAADLLLMGDIAAARRDVAHAAELVTAHPEVDNLGVRLDAPAAVLNT